MKTLYPRLRSHGMVPQEVRKGVRRGVTAEICDRIPVACGVLQQFLRFCASNLLYGFERGFSRGGAEPDFCHSPCAGKCGEDIPCLQSVAGLATDEVERGKDVAVDALRSAG